MSLLFGIQTVSLAKTQAPKGTDIVAVFAQQSKQPFSNRKDRISFLDTVWFYFSDNSFVQYAFLGNKPVLFSKGTYRFGNGGGFASAEAGVRRGDLIIKRNAKYVDKKGLQKYASERTYDLDNIGFRQIFCRENRGKKIVAVFAGANKQPYGDRQLLDTYWIFFDDMTFEQYACPGSDPVLFSEGTYSLSDKAGFKYDADKTDFGKITISRTKKLQPGLKYADYTSSHTYNLNTLGFSLLVLDED